MDDTAAAKTVGQLLERRQAPKNYEQQCQYALDLVEMHLHEENPERIDECIKLYAEDAIWEAPARGVAYTGRERIKEMYMRLFFARKASVPNRSNASRHPTGSSMICGSSSVSLAMASRTARSRLARK